MKPKDKHHPLPKRRSNYLTILLIIIIMLLTVIIGILLLRQPEQPHPPHGPGEELTSPAERQAEAIGIVVSFSADNRADINALNIRLLSGELLQLNFKPHMARQIMALAAVNSKISTTYILRGGKDKVHYDLLNITNLNTKVFLSADELPPPPRRRGNETAKTYAIKNPQIFYDPRGDLTGLQYKNLFFQLPPGQVSSIKGLITNTNTLSVLAAPRDKNAGFMNINNNDVYQVISITIGAQTFLLR